ncbi:aquaporin-11-like [Neosynchiropus ocellatus]
MADLWVSVSVLGVAVLLSEVIRRAAAQLSPSAVRICALEAASTFQLCCCTHELKLLGETARLELGVALTLTYLMTVVHLHTFREASCNPTAALERLCRGRSSGAAAAALVFCQFGAAVAARHFAAAVWSLGLSDVHLRHRRFGFRCFDPLGGTLVEAAAVELCCAFVVQAAALNIHRVGERLRAHAFAALITALVYAGGSISGAMFNPVLAYSVQFPCSGHTTFEYVLVYWLAPVAGVASCVLLLERIIPFLSGKSKVKVARTKLKNQ